MSANTAVRCFAMVLLGLSLLGISPHPLAGADREPGFLTCMARPSAAAGVPLRVGTEVRTGAGERKRILLGGGAIVYVNEKTTVKRPSLLTSLI